MVNLLKAKFQFPITFQIQKVKKLTVMRRLFFVAGFLMLIDESMAQPPSPSLNFLTPLYSGSRIG
jgi:hypothetical protein